MRPDYYKVKVKGRLISGGPPKPDGPFFELECFDLIEALGFDFFAGNVLKYVFRMGRKSPSRVSELEKIRSCCDRMIAEERASESRKKSQGSDECRSAFG